MYIMFLYIESGRNKFKIHQNIYFRVLKNQSEDNFFLLKDMMERVSGFFSNDTINNQ